MDRVGREGLKYQNLVWEDFKGVLDFGGLIEGLEKGYLFNYFFWVFQIVVLEGFLPPLSRPSKNDSGVCNLGPK